MKKPSLIDKLTGMVGGSNDYDDYFEDEEPLYRNAPVSDEAGAHAPLSPRGNTAWNGESEHLSEGELSVDVYQTPEEVVVKALVAGVLPANVEISLSRDMITIEGTREEEREVEDGDYFQRELYWGSFSRTILLPAEVDVDMAEANEKHGILVIRLPKINKAKQTKLRVRSK